MTSIHYLYKGACPNLINKNSKKKAFIDKYELSFVENKIMPKIRVKTELQTDTSWSAISPRLHIEVFRAFLVDNRIVRF